MTRKPLATGLLLVVALLAAASCSSGDDAPSPGDTSSPDKTDSTKTTTDGPSTKLEKHDGKGDIKNVIVKTEDGGKFSLAAKAPGHELMEQTYDPDAKTWSEPTSVFKDDARFCHAIKVKHKASTYAVTVVCSISAKDTSGTQSSYVLGSTDGKTWKKSDLSGASGKPILSASGSFVAWSTPTSFLLWDPKGTYKTVKYTQDAKAPTIGLVQDNGLLLMLKATPGKQDSCTFSFESASAAAPTPKLINNTLPQSGHPKCAAVSAKFQGTEIIGDFNSTTSTKSESGKRVSKTTIFSVAFSRLPTGKWIVKA